LPKERNQSSDILAILITKRIILLTTFLIKKFVPPRI